MDNSWLPVFTTASSRLRSIFSAIRSDHRPKMAFLLKWEMGGMLLLGIALEASVLQQVVCVVFFADQLS